MSLASQLPPAMVAQILHPRFNSGARGYALAVLAVAGALLLRWLLHEILGQASPFLIFVVAVLLAARFGGFGPGLLATMLSALTATFFFLRPEGSMARHPLPDLLLLDLKLPRFSGFEVLQWLRDQPGLRRLPVIVLTGSREPSDVNRALDLGANSYLVKPVGFDALLDIVRTLDLYWLTYNERPTLNPS